VPRLVFADWLDDNCRAERAEFIRVQVELAGLGPDDPRRERLEDRERALLWGGHDREWAGPLVRLVPSWVPYCQQVRTIHALWQALAKRSLGWRAVAVRGGPAAGVAA
jgi:hypothetical protein